MKRITYLILFSCLLIFQSCFEIVEEVFLKNDGTGNFQLTLNLSKSKTKLSSILQMKTINGHDVPTKNQIKNKITTVENAFAKTDGISNVKTTTDFDNYIFAISGNFKNITQLNNAVKNIIDKGNLDKRFIEKSYAYDATAKKFERLNKISLKEDYKKMSNADKEIFADAYYTAIYKFESAVNTTSNSDAKISGSKKAVMLRLNALDVVTNKKSIENKIQLNK